MAIAGLLISVPFLVRRPSLPRRASWLAVLAGVFFAADLAAWATGVTLSGAANPTLLANTAPIWVGIGALLLFKEHLPGGFWGGMVLALIGSGLVLGLERGSAVVGSLLGLLAGVFYAGYFLLTQRARKSLDSLNFFWLYTASSAVALLGLALTTGLPLAGYPARSYAVFLIMGIVTQIFGYFSISYALGHLPASLVAPTLLGQPVLTAVLAVPLLGEQLSGLQVVGGVGVLLGVLTVHRTRAR
jgi:drug/metabolite transporter (DMT)-like permease